MPNKAKPAKDRPLYRRKPPKTKSPGQNLQNSQDKTHFDDSVKNPHFLPPTHFTLREDGSVPNSKKRDITHFVRRGTEILYK